MFCSEIIIRKNLFFWGVKSLSYTWRRRSLWRRQRGYRGEHPLPKRRRHGCGVVAVLLLLFLFPLRRRRRRRGVGGDHRGLLERGVLGPHDVVGVHLEAVVVPLADHPGDFPK